MWIDNKAKVNKQGYTDDYVSDIIQNTIKVGTSSEEFEIDLGEGIRNYYGSSHPSTDLGDMIVYAIRAAYIAGKSGETLTMFETVEMKQEDGTYKQHKQEQVEDWEENRWH